MEPETLAARFREGDESLVGPWFEAEWPRVYRLCLGFLADPVEAQDVAQDGILHLRNRLSSWSGDGSYSSFRTTVILNLCRDRLRRIDARKRAETRALERRPESMVPDPSEIAAQAEVQDLLRSALRELSPREREVFVLRDLEGSSFADVALVLGVTESTVRSLLTLARRRLRTVLGPALAKDFEGGRDG
jgi:RNA polymerase sigma-70 factor (ECF subfamily)